MKWKRPRILVILIAFALAAALVTIYLSKKVEKSLPKTSGVLWELALEKIYQVWKGDIDLNDSHFQNNCPHFIKSQGNVPRELKGCRAELLTCYFKNRKLSLKDGSKYHDFKVISSSLHKHISVSLGQESKTFELNDFCRQVKLPEGAYWGDRSKNKGQRIWHTSGVKYSIDRFLVRNIDIREWLRHEDGKDHQHLKSIYVDGKKEINWFEPNVDLRPKEMKDYCRYRKAEILSSSVRAAITFHHGRPDKGEILKEPPSYNTPPHPFGLRQQDSPQYRFSHSKERLSADREDCRLIYASECFAFPYRELFPNSMGWSGVSEIFGGPAEYVENLKYPRKNLHPSSYYHPMESKVHQAGVRVYWSGKGHRRIDFNFFTEPFFSSIKEQAEDSFDVGFRCMTRRLVKKK